MKYIPALIFTIPIAVSMVKLIDLVKNSTGLESVLAYGFWFIGSCLLLIAALYFAKNS